MGTGQNGIWVSELNGRPEVRKAFEIGRVVQFYDTTLRDGEQSVGVVLTPQQKLEIAHGLDNLGVGRIEAGFPRVSPDDAEAFGLEAVEFLVRSVREWVSTRIPLHFHGHNDFGMATACAVAAVRGGAEWIQGTINGMGERAGNANIGEVAMALTGLYGVPVKLDLRKIREVSALVRRAAGHELEPWKPVVGENLFMRESGAVASQFHIPEAIEPFSAELVGATRAIVLG